VILVAHGYLTISYTVDGYLTISYTVDRDRSRRTTASEGVTLRALRGRGRDHFFGVPGDENAMK